MSNDSWLTGKIVRGDGRGRQLGFPTANIQLPTSVALPAAGVYAGVARLENDTAMHVAAIHVGPAPTFERERQTLEVHMLDFPDRDLYDERLSTQIQHHIRDIEKFASVDELVVAIEDDCEQARQLLDDA